MLHILKSYIKFLWNSKNEHGVHSPFVFDLVTKCFYNKTKHPEYEVLDDYRFNLLLERQIIEVFNFGGGSRSLKSNKRKISDIAKNNEINRNKTKLLFRIVRYFQPSEILEIGTSLGLATHALSLASEFDTKIISVEECPEILKYTNRNFLNYFSFDKLDTINFVNPVFSTFLKKYQLETTTKNCEWKLIYFNKSQSKKSTLDYFELLLPTVTNYSVWIINDIHKSIENEDTWEIIKKHPKVKVTIDTFHFGMVFFRAEQEKEHFVIRV
ncbi:MAG: class I SAM-dependent methyltransferase [Flavobacterium sp.]